jgi:putative salt-induced outer membrane protein YdiY
VHRPVTIRPLWVLALAATLLSVAVPAAAQKTDVVELKNGDRITCEIQRLERAKLVVKTDGLGTISIEWDDVARLASAREFSITLTSGRRVFGPMIRGDAATVDVVSAGEKERLSLPEVVAMSPLGGTFWKRLDGSIDAGFSFTQANVQTQWTLNSKVSYRTRHWLTNLTGDSALTIREDADRQSRNTVTLATNRELKPLWAALAFTNLQQNEELGLNLRTVLGGGIGRVLLRTNRTTAGVLGGAAFTRESYVDTDPDSVAEIVAGANWEWFTFDGRSTTVNVSALSFYALNHDGRVRLELNSAFKSDIVSDLYWTINVFESLNTEPPPDRKKNDFGVSAAMGWSF